MDLEARGLALRQVALIKGGTTMKPLIIALDYDGTFTADPLFWTNFVRGAFARGHQVIIATMRRNIPSEWVTLPDVLAHVEVIYTACEAKREVVLSCGYKVDIWIDDNPQWVDTNAGDFISGGKFSND
jgi:hypothetical protein